MSLLTLTRTQTLTCTTCNVPRIQGTEDETGVQIEPNPTPGSNDTVQAAVDRTMQGTFTPGANCPLCSVVNVTYNTHHTIDAAPEYLRIYINLKQRPGNSTKTDHQK
jgi:hypothetical protein